MSSFKPNYFQRRSKPQGPKANERIRALDVQVIRSEGGNLGAMPLNKAIELAKQAGQLASKFLKKPHDLEYEKTFWPWVLLSKKRYVGMLYEDDPEKGKLKYMGIVLKRRDNAPVVKDIYGGVITKLIETRLISKSLKFVDSEINKLLKGEIILDKLLITKSLFITGVFKAK